MGLVKQTCSKSACFSYWTLNIFDSVAYSRLYHGENYVYIRTHCIAWNGTGRHSLRRKLTRLKNQKRQKDRLIVSRHPRRLLEKGRPPLPKKTTNKRRLQSQNQPVRKQKTPKKTPNKPPPKQTTQKSPPKPTGKTKTNASPAKQRTGQEPSQGNAHKPIGAQSSTNTNRPSYNRAPNNVEQTTSWE